MKRSYIVVVSFLSVFTTVSPVYAADCTGPSGVTGQVIYNSTEHVNQYCDGTAWIEMGRSSTSGSSNCSNPTEAPGTIIYNSDDNIMQYCNGAVWVSMGTMLHEEDDLELVSHWKLDESSGTTLHDTGVLENDGSFVNSPTWVPSSGYIDGAVDFDGDTDYISIPYERSIRPTFFTVSLWANTDVMESAALMRSAGGNGWDTGGYRITLDGYDINFTCNNNSGSRYYLDNEWSPVVGEWFNIMVKYGSDGQAQTYYNGAPGKTVGAQCRYTSSGDMWLGVSSGVEEFDGKIDDVRIYNRGLTDDEINNLFMDMTGPISDVTSGLIGHWKLDESSGTTAYDSSGNGFDGTLTNGPTWNPTTGMLNGSLFFYDSDLSYVDIPYSATLEPSSQITYSFWVYVVENGSYERIIHRRRDYHDVRLYPSGNVVFKLRVNGTTYSVDSGFDLGLNAWHHVVAAYDGSEIAVYVDGEYRNGQAVTGSIDTYGSSFNLKIGRDTSFSNVGEAFDGNIDDVRIYNRGLTPSEVKQLYFYRHRRDTSSFTPSSCANPTGSVGDMVFNTDYSVMQYCNGADWVAIGKSILAPCGSNPSPGQLCSDGTVYAGRLSDKRIYVAKVSSSTGETWNDGSTSWSYTGATNMVNGRINTEILANLTDTPSPYNAADLCDVYSENGYDDWYLPSRAEMLVVSDNKTAINAAGNLTDAIPDANHWTSSETYNASAVYIDTTNSSEGSTSKPSLFDVRCIRSQ